MLLLKFLIRWCLNILNLFNISMLLHKCIFWWFWFDVTTKALNFVDLFWPYYQANNKIKKVLFPQNMSNIKIISSKLAWLLARGQCEGSHCPCLPCINPALTLQFLSLWKLFTYLWTKGACYTGIATCYKQVLFISDGKVLKIPFNCSVPFLLFNISRQN